MYNTYMCVCTYKSMLVFSDRFIHFVAVAGVYLEIKSWL